MSRVSVAKDMISQFYDQLMDEVPLEDTEFYEMAISIGLIPPHTHADIEALTERAQRVRYLLENIIMQRAAHYLPVLLEVMKSYKDPKVVHLAYFIEATFEEASEHICTYSS